MSNIVIAFSKPEVAAGIKKILTQSGYSVQAVCTTGAQALASVNNLECRAGRCPPTSRRSAAAPRAESFIGEPDTVAGSVVRNIEVTRKMIEYSRTKPTGMEPAPAAVYQTAPTRIISVADIRVHVKGLKYAARGRPAPT